MSAIAAHPELFKRTERGAPAEKSSNYPVGHMKRGADKVDPKTGHVTQTWYRVIEYKNNPGRTKWSVVGAKEMSVLVQNNLLPKECSSAAAAATTTTIQPKLTGLTPYQQLKLQQQQQPPPAMQPLYQQQPPPPTTTTTIPPFASFGVSSLVHPSGQQQPQPIPSFGSVSVPSFGPVSVPSFGSVGTYGQQPYVQHPYGQHPHVQQPYGQQQQQPIPSFGFASATPVTTTIPSFLNYASSSSSNDMLID